MTDRLEAARARRGAVRQASHRPTKRGTPAYTTRTTLDESNGFVHFTGLASAYETPYDMYDEFGPYTEIVSAGAGARSLATPGLDVTLNIGHDQTRRIAATLNGTLALAESVEGLTVDAPKLDMNDHDVSYIVPKIRSGLITEMSFAFRITRGSWSPDYTEYRIDEYDLQRGDVAIVGYGANPHTSVNLRSQPTGKDLISDDELHQLEYPWW